MINIMPGAGARHRNPALPLLPLFQATAKIRLFFSTGLLAASKFTTTLL
jgi:hypothetical protein